MECKIVIIRKWSFNIAHYQIIHYEHSVLVVLVDVHYRILPLHIFCFAKKIRIIEGEYEQRAVYKRSNVVGNGPGSVLKASGAIYRVNYQIQRGFLWPWWTIFCLHTLG